MGYQGTINYWRTDDKDRKTQYTSGDVCNVRISIKAKHIAL